jgi:hypothetical protein
MPLRLRYGSTNKYRPVSRSKARMATAERPNLLLYFPCTTIKPLIMTATVKINGEAAVGLPSPFAPVQLNLLCCDEQHLLLWMANYRNDSNSRRLQA